MMPGAVVISAGPIGSDKPLARLDAANPKRADVKQFNFLQLETEQS